MTLSYKTLLIACIPLSLQSMEQQNSDTNAQNMALIKQYGSDLNSLYKKTYSFLESYKGTHPETIVKLLDIINTTDQLKIKNDSEKILEKHIGMYSFMQHKSPMFRTNPPYCDSNYVSVFFARLEAYDNNIKKNKFTTPTLEQFTGHKNNVAIRSAVNIAVNFRLYLEVVKISAEKHLFTVIPDNLALIEVENLIEDITKMLNEVPGEIKTLAEILYAETVEFNTNKKL